MNPIYRLIWFQRMKRLALSAEFQKSDKVLVIEENARNNRAEKKAVKMGNHTLDFYIFVLLGW